MKASSLVEAVNLFKLRGGSSGLVVMGQDSCSEGHRFKSRHHMLELHFSHIFVVKFVMMFVCKD